MSKLTVRYWVLRSKNVFLRVAGVSEPHLRGQLWVAYHSSNIPLVIDLQNARRTKLCQYNITDGKKQENFRLKKHQNNFPSKFFNNVSFIAEPVLCLQIYATVTPQKLTTKTWESSDPTLTITVHHWCITHLFTCLLLLAYYYYLQISCEWNCGHNSFPRDTFFLIKPITLIHFS